MAAPWQSGTLYQPGDLVRPTNSGVIAQPPLDNPDFDLGSSGWTSVGLASWTIDTDPPVFNGTFSGKAGFTSNPNGSQQTVTNDAVLPCVPGQIITARCFAFGPTGSGDVPRMQFQIDWYNASMAPLAPSKLALDPTPVFGEPRIDALGLVQYACREIWLPLSVEGIAPAAAAFFTVSFVFSWGDMSFAVDGVSLEYTNASAANTLLFRAVQATAGFSGNNEPTWPTSIGLTVVDNEVTWEAVAGTSVTWQASRILVSACPASSEDVEPVWPLLVNGAVPDGSISWTLDSRRVTDTHVPSDSEIVLLAASKVYAADRDIIDYSATVNPLDWSTPEDAGFIPFGLQVYGANPITAMGLYRGNIAAFNSQGCQIWQVDPDPAAITLLDAIPVPCTFPKSLAPVGDDLAFLSNLGIRSLGVAGAEINLQGGYFGKQVDPLVVAAIAEALEEGWTPRGLYWPAHGQYWLFFGAQAFVLTINGPGKEQRSWSRYTFPEVVDAWTIKGTDLFLRSGDLIWQVDVDALEDDEHEEASEYQLELETRQEYGTGWVATDTVIPLGGTQAQADGTPVLMWGPVLTGIFTARTITVGAVGASQVTCSATMAAAGAGDVLIVRYPLEGPFTVVDGNDVGSTTIELSAALTSYIAAGTVLRIARAGGTDFNYLRRAVLAGDTVIELARPLENEAIAIRVFAAGCNVVNVNSNDVMYAIHEIDGVAGAVVTLDRPLTAAAVGLQVIATEFHETTIEGGVGTTNAVLADAVPFDNDGSVSPELGFPAAGVLIGPYALFTVGEPFTSVIQWPFLDLNNFSSDKELVGFDLSIEGVCSMSIGFDQRFTEYDAAGPWTAAYEIDGDTMPGQMVPFSVSGPSFALRLEFASGQAWKWWSAALHIKDLAP